jgi:ribosomal protein L7Ae-like RNA K-turn-binding protein
MDKALDYLGIARKAGLLTTGAENCGTAVRTGKAKLLLLASDASENARHRAEGFVFGRKTPLAVLPFDKETLSERTGKPGCTMLAFTDIGLASRFAAALALTEPRFAELASALEAKEKKAAERKAEAEAHARNRKGRKKV